MTRRDWWLSIVVIAACLLTYVAFPRYEWRGAPPNLLIRIDRWTGHAERGYFKSEGWTSLADAAQQKAAADKKTAEDLASAHRAARKAEIAARDEVIRKANGQKPLTVIRRAPDPPTDLESPVDVDVLVKQYGGTVVPAERKPLQPKAALAASSTAPPPRGRFTADDIEPAGCEFEHLVRPASSAELGGKYRGGLGRVSIVNGAELDALAVLIDEASNEPRRAIYIRTGEVGLITSIPRGRYRLRFQFGDRWLQERRFCELSGTAEFDETFAFAETTDESGTRYDTFEVTLHAVPSGTARTQRLADLPLALPAQ